MKLSDLRDRKGLILLTITQMRAKLRAAVKTAGGQKKFAEQIEVSPQYICDCLSGRRDVGIGISRALGFEPVTMYVRSPVESKGHTCT